MVRIDCREDISPLWNDLRLSLRILKSSSVSLGRNRGEGFSKDGLLASKVRGSEGPGQVICIINAWDDFRMITLYRIIPNCGLYLLQS